MMKTKTSLSLFVRCADVIRWRPSDCFSRDMFFRFPARQNTTTISAFNGYVRPEPAGRHEPPVQTVTSLPGGTNWVNYVQLPVTQAVNTNLLVAFNPPAGMALISAGSFTMGDALGDGASWELPLHTVYVSAFYMDKYDVTKALWDDFTTGPSPTVIVLLWGCGEGDND